MAKRKYTATYRPKPAAIKAGMVEIEYTVNAGTKVLAKALADEALNESGESYTNYFEPKIVWLKNGSAALPEQSPAEATNGQGDSAADKQSIEPGHHDQLDQLYGGSDPALPADESGLSDEGCEPLNSAGSPESKAEKTQLEKLQERLRNLQESLPYADGQAYYQQEREIAEVRRQIAEIENPADLKPLVEMTAQERQAVLLDEINAKVSALTIGERLRLEDVPAEVYHPSIGWGSTRLKDYIKSPALARAGIDGHMEKAPTKSMRMGTAYHAACLEPELFRSEYTQADDMPINQAEYDDVIRMRDATLTSVGYLLQGGASEVSYWYCVSKDLVIKCRVDYELPRLALDLKSATDVSDDGIASAVDRFGYALQQEHYKLASGYSQFAFLFQQNAAPWLTSLPVQLDDDLVEFAQLKLEKTYREIEQSEANDYWPVNRSADDGGVQTLVVGLKGWKRRELEQLRMEA